jgi:hypothetical protein
MKPGRCVALLCGIALLAGCGLVPEKVAFDDARVVELLKAAETFDREVHGFTPIPRDAEFRLETARGAYDRMLHIYGLTSRTIAFRKTDSGFKWIHEQEIFTGPREYESPDGIFKETICLTYESERIASFRAGELSITYFGEDRRLAFKGELKLEDVLPVLREWGYAAVPDATTR